MSDRHERLSTHEEEKSTSEEEEEIEFEDTQSIVDPSPLTRLTPPTPFVASPRPGKARYPLPPVSPRTGASTSPLRDRTPSPPPSPPPYGHL